MTGFIYVSKETDWLRRVNVDDSKKVITIAGRKILA